MAEWRTILCDINGNQLSDLSGIAYNRRYTEQLNAPSSFSFELDPSDPKASTVHTDGAPYLEYIRRTVKAYRREEQADGSHAWVLRFNGFVWPVQDNGDDEGNTLTAVTCYDPLIMFGKRLCRSAAGSFVKVTFAAVDPVQILKQLVSNTNTNAGPTGLVWTATGADPALAALSVEWSYKMMDVAFKELTAGFDVGITPREGTLATGLGTITAYARRGTTRTAQLGWRYAPNNLTKVTRIQDPSDACNVLVGVGNGAEAAVVVATDAASISDYLQLEGLTSLPDVTDAAYLNSVVASSLYDRLPQQEAVSVGDALVPGIQPWVDFTTGDTVTVTAHPALRGGVLRQQKRIFGWSMPIDDEDNEVISFVTEREGGT